MASKLAPGFYNVSSTESLFITITGPYDPYVFLGGNVVPAVNAQPIEIKPQLLNGLGSYNVLGIRLLFPTDGTRTHGYTLVVADAGRTTIDTLTFPSAASGSSTKVELDITVS